MPMLVIFATSSVRGPYWLDEKGPSGPASPRYKGAVKRQRSAGGMTGSEAIESGCTNVVDEDLASSGARLTESASVASTAANTIMATAATRWSGEARFGLTVLQQSQRMANKGWKAHDSRNDQPLARRQGVPSGSGYSAC